MAAQGDDLEALLLKLDEGFTVLLLQNCRTWLLHG